MTWTRDGKTNKSLMKRIKITGTDRILKRRPGQNHFNAKTSGNITRGKKGDKEAPFELIDEVKQLIRITKRH